MSTLTISSSTVHFTFSSSPHTDGMEPNSPVPPSRLHEPATPAPRTIRLRLTLAYTAVLGATLLLFSGMVYAVLATYLRAALVQETERQAYALAAAITQQLEGKLVIAPEHTQMVPLGAQEEFSLEMFATNSLVQVIDHEGNILKQSEALASAGLALPKDQRALRAVQQGSSHSAYFSVEPQAALTLVYSTPLYRNSGVVGAVQVMRSVEPVEDTLGQVSRHLVLGTILSLLLAAGVGAFLAKRL